MATIHRGVTESEFRATRHSGRNRSLERYHERAFADDGILSRVSGRFRERAEAVLDKFERIRRRVSNKISTRKTRVRGRTDAFEQLLDIAEFQNAGRRQRRAVMANPNATRRKRMRMLAGYAEDLDIWDDHNCAGHRHSNQMYRAIESGRVVREDDGKHYVYNYVHDKDTLALIDTLGIDAWARGNIRIMWDNFDHLLDGNEDPTSECNAAL